jgi:hypothetical protein
VELALVCVAWLSKELIYTADTHYAGMPATAMPAVQPSGSGAQSTRFLAARLLSGLPLPRVARVVAQACAAVLDRRRAMCRNAGASSQAMQSCCPRSSVAAAAAAALLLALTVMWWLEWGMAASETGLGGENCAALARTGSVLGARRVYWEKAVTLNTAV